MQISLSSSIPDTTAKRSIAEVDALLHDARPWMYRLALAIVTQPDVAEDVAQEALIRATRSRSKLASVAEPKAWLRTVVARCAISALNQSKKPTRAEQAVSRDPTDTLAVHQTLNRLDPTDRVLLALAHFDELSYAEMGDVLNIAVGTVASRLHAAREAFRKEWRK